MLRYVNILRRRWLPVVVLGVVGALLAFGYTSLLPKTYRAESDLTIVRSGTLLTLDPRYLTISDTDPNTGLDQLLRRASLTSVGTSDEFAASVIAQLGDRLPLELRTPRALLQQVALTSESDVIRISVNADSPELAALIANSWATLYEARLNALFGEQAANPTQVNSQAQEARAAYDTREAELVAFLKSTSLQQLQRQQTLLASQLDAQVNVENKLLQLQADAEALRARVSAGADTVSAGDELAVTLLQANAFNNGGGLPAQLNFTLPVAAASVTREQLVAQLDSIIAAMQARRAALGGASAAAQYRELASVQSQLEAAQAKQKELTAARDLAWSTYQLVAGKVSETAVKTGTQNQIVRVAFPAIAPSSPLESRRLLNTVVGGLLGLAIGALAAIALDLFPGRTPVLKRAA
jgi:uncharacterized protein involved in exopolysaccharide biosynthesis